MADVMIKITEFVMGFAPYGIGALVACVAGTIGGKMMTTIAKFFVADYAAIPAGMFVVYPLAVGAAGVKGAGIVMSAVFFESLGLPLGLVPILAAIWPVIDIPHTTGNVTGDMVGTMAACARFGKVDWNVFNADA